MARIFTTPDAENAAKAWIHDLTIAAGIRTNDQRTAGSNMFIRYKAQPYARAACDELINRDFENIDSAIRQLAQVSYYPSLTLSTSYKNAKPEGIAKMLVYAAEILGLYWDDTIRTPFEIDEFKKTLLGAAVYKYNRYISAIPSKTKSKSSSNAATGSNTSGQPAGQPKNNYKQSGPQSGNVRDLRDVDGNPGGTPGAKVMANGAYIYKIIGDNAQSKNTPHVFIKPLNAGGAEGSTNKVFISSGNAYTDCTCYFDDPNDATTFLNKVLSSNRVPTNVTNLRVVKLKADSNGYFIVGTEFGVCAVSARTLNEALTEAAKANEREVNWEKATEGYTKEELDELHTWMRRG